MSGRKANYKDMLHPIEQNTIDGESQIGMTDVSECLPGWIETLCEKFKEGKGMQLSHHAVNALCHTLIAARVRCHRLIAERDAALNKGGEK